MNEIKNSWNEFCKLPFPENLAGELINGIDPVSIDSFAAGCISTFIANGGSLDNERISILNKCMSDIKSIEPSLNSENQSYYEILFTLGKAVLKKCQMPTKS